MSSPKHLPVIDGHVAESSLQTDGSRKRIIPADVTGRFMRWRRVVFVLLIGIWIALPWIPVRGRPAVFLDVETRSFFLFGLSFNAQDTWLLFFLLAGFFFALVFATALLGRAWCGWACPQTVFLEGIFRPIERLVGGTREQRMKGIPGAKRVVLHVLYVLSAMLVAHIFVSYFVSLPRLFSMMRHAPTEHPEAFAWMIAITGIFYGNFAWFREQFCVVMCPYGRMQSMLLDDSSLIVGYDEKRGEPRGKKGSTTGDCVDCKRCVVVCPTGIDIRNGLQLDCVACTACIDACDEIMVKLDRPKGLIRYDSQEGLRGHKTRWVRPRTIAYAIFFVAGGVVAFFAARTREPFEANVLRLPGAPYTHQEGAIRNSFEVHLVNKESHAEHYTLSVDVDPGYQTVMPMKTIELQAQSAQRIPVFVSVPDADFHGETAVKVHILAEGSKAHRDTTVRFLGAVSPPAPSASAPTAPAP